SEDTLDLSDDKNSDSDYDNETEDEEDQKALGNHQFILEYMEKVASFARPDQSSFHYEMAPNRTLSYVGEKTTYVSVNSINATTHFYTVMPIITAVDQLINPVFICLQERTGQFPVTKKIFSSSNIVTTCSESGKVSTDQHTFKHFLASM
ncbi:unnamed protein product, partial [Rotaria sp. Silwood2]